MILVRLLARTRSLNLGASALLCLLQRTPVVRALLTAENELATPAAQLLRAMLAPAAALGAVHTLAGASTQLVANVNLPAKATVGQPFAMSVAITGLGVSFAQSWDVTNSLPPGVVPAGGVLSGGQWVINPSSGTLTLTGTPTASGTFSFTARGYQFTGRTGPVTSGSTSIVVAAAPNSAPTITKQPAAQTVTAGGTITLSVTYTGTPAPTFQWFKSGVAIAGATGPMLTVSNAAASDAGTYTLTITNSLGAVTSSAAQITVNAAPTAPVFAASPVSQTVVAGAAVIFSVDVSGVPVPALQWLKDGSGIDGANGATLILNNVSSADSGFYSVTASNASGVVTSAAALLTVTPGAVAPKFSAFPAPLTAALGSTVVFNAAATGTPTPAYQWLHNGASISGATSAALVLGNTTAADAGLYSVVATNASGTISSSAAALTLTVSSNPGRLINLSILTALASGENMALGTVLGGAGTSGPKALLARAAGPALAQLGVTGVLPDPQMSLIASSTGATVATNNDWAGVPALSNAFAQVGAFGYASPLSKDAAIFQPTLAPGSYTVQVSDATGGAGTVIAELYDSTPASAFTPTTPRLVNVSVLKQISTGATLTVGFVIGGSTAKTVLVRAIGPGLAQFGVGGTMPDPQLALFSGAATIAQNDNWGGDPQLTAAGNSVGAFAIATTDSKDAMLLLTLAPGNYTAQASPVSGTAGGTALVEVYEVP